MTGFFSQVPLVVSYYTKGTPYEEEVKALRESCEKFGIECHIEGVENKGSWEENCAYKPYFIREMMKRFRRPLLWVDADAVFLRPLPFEECMFADLAVIRIKEDQGERFCIYSGTVYINATQGGIKGLNLWCHFSDKMLKEEGKAPPFMDQISLHLVLLAKASIQIDPLPLTYAKIFDKSVEGVDASNVMIEQRQASRRFKSKV